MLFSSAEYEDLAHLCDRVLVFHEGRVAAILTGADLTEDRIVEQCYRAEKASSTPVSRNTPVTRTTPAAADVAQP